MNAQYERYAINPDREFASRLQVELEARLSARPPSATDLTEENELMSVQREQLERGRRRWMLAVAAALIALVGAGVALITRDADTSSPPANGSAQPTVSTTPNTTAAPTTTSTTTTTTLPPLPDNEIAGAVLLQSEEYNAPGFYKVPSLPVRMNADIASQHPECAAYVDVAFESPARPAEVANEVFYRAAPPAASALFEYVVVLPNVAQARAMFDAIREPAFLGQCVPAYRLSFPARCCQELTEWFPFFVGTDLDPPTLDTGADDIWVRVYEATWTDDGGVVHGPERFIWAGVRVGRVFASVEGELIDENDTPLMTLSHFEESVKRIVERATAAQRGIVLP